MSLDETPLLHFNRGWFFLPTIRGINRTPVANRRRVATENGTALDPRYEISSDKFIIRDVTESDEGFLSYNETKYHFNLARISVKDCSSRVTKDFGSDYLFEFPKNAYSLEFSPLENNNNGAQSQVLWNRTNPQASEAGGRGRKRNNSWIMNQITYEYAGYYTFRDENHKFISRNRINVEGTYQSFEKVQGEDVDITFGIDPVLLDMTFQSDSDYSEKEVLMKEGELQKYNTWMFAGRIRKLPEPTLHITIEDLQPSDSGRFEFTDVKGNKGFVVDMMVKDRYPPYVRYIVAAVSVLTVVFCCCYVRKRCCKKTARKNHSVPETEAAPDVYYHDDNTQPSTSAHPSASHGPTYSYPLYHNQPGPTPQPPMVTVPEDPHMSSSQPEAGAASSQEPPSYDSLFSGAEPQFELRGTFPSAPPLSSDTPYSDVYTSDKLNFM